VRGLYPILDLDALEATQVTLADLAERVLRVRPPLLQLRAKSHSAREILAAGRVLLDLCAAHGNHTRLVMNDRADLAAMLGAPLVHVGQKDAPLADVQRAFPHLGVGISTHTVDEVRAAARLRPAYIAFGPVFPTESKKNPEPTVGIEGLAAARAVVDQEAPGTPLVAIGGISLARCEAVVSYASMAAVISALVRPDATEHARSMHLALGGA